MSNDDEAFSQLQYSKGFGRCSKCKLVRPFKHLMMVDGVRLCRDAKDCARMKLFKEEDDRGEAQVVAQQAVRAVERATPERSAPITFWNSSDPTLI